MVRTILAVMFCLAFTSGAEAQSLNLMPLPAKVQMARAEKELADLQERNSGHRLESRFCCAWQR